MPKAKIHVSRKYKKLIRKIREFDLNRRHIRVALSPDIRVLGTTYATRRLFIWDVASGKKVATLTRSRTIYDLFFAPSGDYLVSCGITAATIWDTNSWKKVASIGIADEIIFISFSPDGEYIALTSDYDTTIFTRRGKWVSLTPHDPCSVSFTPDGKYLVYQDKGDPVLAEMPDLENTIKLREIYRVEESRVTPDGKYLVAAGDYHVSVWDLSRRKQIKIFDTEDDMHTVRISSNGRYAAAIGRDLSIVIDTSSWEKIATIEYDLYGATGGFVAGKYLIVRNGDLDIYAPDGERIATIEHTRNLSGADYVGNYIVTASFDGSVAIWRVG